MKKNYYSIHKNKKKRKSIQRSQIDTLKLLHHATKLVYSLMNLKSAMLGIMPIPKYKLGSNNADLMIVNDSHKQNLYESEKVNIIVPEWYEEANKIDPKVFNEIILKNKTFEM